MPSKVNKRVQAFEHPLDDLLRTDRIPHIWCPGCGIGTAFSSCLTAMKSSQLDLQKVAMVSGIGCSGRAAGYVKLDSFHTTHGRAIPFATGLKLGNPELNVVVFSGDGDLFAIGGNHFIHAARRNIDLTVVCVNNLNYGMTGGQVAATTPFQAKTPTTPAGNPEPPFNLPLMAYASGASYVARWTILHTRDLLDNITSSFRFEYSVQKSNNSGPANEEFLTRLEFRQNRDGWNWNAKVDTHWDPDGFTYIGDRNQRYTDRVP